MNIVRKEAVRMMMRISLVPMLSLVSGEIHSSP